MALITWDLALTLLHPSARGPVSYATNRLSWLAVRRGSILFGRPGLVPGAGPAAVAASLMVWTLGLLVGYALIYLPFIEDFSFQPSGFHGDTGFADALYVSTASFTTVGFGDVIAPTDALRLVTVLEGGNGLAVITAAIAYLLSVFPLVTSLRTRALHLSDLGAQEPGWSAWLAAEGGSGKVNELHAQLIENDENVRRFPVLYYFDSGLQAESVTAMLRAGIVMCIVLRWGVDHGRLPWADHQGEALERTLRRLMTDYERNFVGGRDAARRRRHLSGATDGSVVAPIERADAERRLRRLRQEIAGVVPGLESSATPGWGAFSSFVARADSFLGALSREHRTDHHSLLTADAPLPPAAGSP